MANQELVNYLISLQAGNYSKTQVKRVLLEVGWPEKDINEAFKLAQTHHDVSMPHLGLQEKSFLIQSLSVLLIIMTGTFLIFGSEPTPTGNVVLTVSPVQTLGVSSEVRVVEEQNAPALISVPTQETAPTLNVHVEEQISVPAQQIFIPEPTPKVTVLSAPPQENCETAVKSDTCLLRHALEQKDEKLCSRIRSSELYSDCMTSLAIEKKQMSLCRETAEPDNCYAEYAEQTGDKTACSRIAKSSIRENCQS